jgi:hypothetical protein
MKISVLLQKRRWLLSLSMMLVLVVCWPRQVSQAQESRAFGFVSLTTVRAPVERGQPDTFAGNVVVGFYHHKGGQEAFVMTGPDGTAFALLRSGHYCAEAYGTDGKLIPLDPIETPSKLCFDVMSGQASEFSLTLVSNAKYSKTVPNLSIS